MSNVNKSFRIMIIDIAEDKIVVDEFCDAIVTGIASSGDNIGETEGSEITCVKGNVFAGIAVVAAAEKAVMTQKKQIIKSFMKKATPEEIMKCFGGENQDEC